MYAKMLRATILIIFGLPIINSSPQFKIPELPTFPPSPEIYKSKNVQSTNTDVSILDKTVKEVEAMLQANPELPRLTRGEILDLLENITKTDEQKQNTLKADLLKQQSIPPRTPKQKNLDSKPLMLVKPYTPENGEIHNMEELFTKPPVTQIVGQNAHKNVIDNMISTNDISPSHNPIRRPTANREQFRRKTTTPTTTSFFPITTTASPTTGSISSLSPPVVQRFQNRRRRPVSTTTTTTSEPETVFPFSSRKPLRRRTTTVKYHNHRYPGDPTPEVTLPPLPNEGLRIIKPPLFNPLLINQDLLGSENQNQEVFLPENNEQTGEKAVGDTQINNGNGFYKTNTVSSIGVDIPDDLKDVMSSMNLDTLIKAEPLKSKPSKSFAHTKKEQYKLEDMLAAFGRLPPTKTTTTTKMPDIGNVADSLSPDMRDLLMSFGLIPNTQQATKKPVSESLVLENYNAQIPETNPEAYVGFKPLPDEDASMYEMRELLARFGLGKGTRQQKALPKNADHEAQGSEDHPVLNFDMVPEEYKDTINDLGFRTGKVIHTETTTKTQEKHVFKPENSQLNSVEELKRIQKLLDFMKKLEQLNGTVTEDDLKKMDKEDLKDFIDTLNEYNRVPTLNELSAPNPLNFGNGLDKNEVKRQESSSATTEAAAVEVSSTEATVVDSSTETTKAISSTTSEDMLSGEEKGPSIKDLEDSFGGKTDPPSTTSPPESTTPLRKTGFYYLVDWNTFFDIDDQKGKRVNLRFQPTIGDPKRFLSVTVP